MDATEAILTRRSTRNYKQADSSAVRRDAPLSDYTCEDYFRDFEFDYLGFEGVPDETAADSKDA